jgi:UDP-N-acetylglucosamine diphosphorylase/glucosamine-1-phosphate N-acetyltransferase
MRLVIFEDEQFENFYPLSLCRAVFELRCGIDDLATKISRWAGRDADAYLIRSYLAETFKARIGGTVNDLSGLAGQRVLFANGRLLAGGGGKPPQDRGAYWLADGSLGWLVTDKDVSSVGSYRELAALAEGEPRKDCPGKAFSYIWDVMLASPHQIAEDFRALGRRGIEGTVEEPSAIRGDKNDVYIARGTTVQPMVVIDASGGPVWLDEHVQVHPFTRIEGPAYVGPKSVLLGTKLREGCSIGPVCRVGGEVEETVIQGFSNKYHDGFLGHAYVGEWVNLGALTTNSDLKNDYSTVEVVLNGKKINTGSTKVGSIIGDHTKTSIATLFNTGAIVGSMALIVATGSLLPKAIPSFAWFVNGVVTKGFGRYTLYQTAKTAMGRRDKQWTQADQALWEHIYELTREEREEAIRRGRRQMFGRGGAG